MDVVTSYFQTDEGRIVLGLLISGICGFIIGAEREMRGKPAGISTQCFVIAGAMLFASLSMLVDPASKSRIAAQVVSGVGFLGAGMILKGDGKKILNLTTAASLWFSAAIGLALGYGYFAAVAAATVFSVVVPRIPHISGSHPDEEEDGLSAPGQ